MQSLILKSIYAERNYEAYLLPVSGYPIPPREFERIESLVAAFCTSASKKWNLFSEVFMQLEQLDSDGCRQAFSGNARRWLPQTGLGVWVDRAPPCKWTKEETSNIIPGDKLRPIMFQVFRVSAAEPIRSQARSTMLRFGPVLEILTPGKEDYLLNSSEIFKEGIVDPSFTCFPYYAGLMEAKTIQNATPDQLDRWFDGMTVYLRQSFQDKGILIAGAAPLSEILDEIGGSRVQGGWTFSE